MDSETKNILKILGVAVVVLFIFRPKPSEKNKNKVSFDNQKSTKPPKTTSKKNSDDEFNDAVASIKAFRSAINNNEPQSELDKLNRLTIKEYGIKVFNKNGKLYARNTSGKNIANEK